MSYGPDDLGMRDEYAGPGSVFDYDPEAQQGGAPYDDDDPDRYGPDGEQIIAPPSGERGETHLAARSSDGTLITACCGLAARDLPDGDRTTPNGDEVDCSWAQSGQGPVDAPGDEPTFDEGLQGLADAVQSEADEPHRTEHDRAHYDPERGVVCACGTLLDSNGDEQRHSPIEPPAGAPRGTALDPIVRSGVPPLDPLVQQTPVDIERAILECVRRLSGGLELEAYWTEQFEHRSHELLKAESLARLKAKGSAKDVRDAEVVNATLDERDAVAEARINREVLRGAMHSLRSVLSGLQSVGRSVGVAYSMGGSDGQAPASRGLRR